MRNALIVMFVLICFGLMSTPAHAAKPGKVVKATKERLVLMPLRVADEDKSLQGAMETALVEGLQQKYEVFSGEQVAQKAREIFMKESRNTAKKECDETRCMQGIAEAFQAELIATANVTKREDGYFLALSVQNIFDNKVVYSKSTPCQNCNVYQVVETLKALSGASVQAAPQVPVVTAIPEAPSASNANDPETALWNGVRSTNLIDDYETYLAQYPKGKFVVLAHSLINKLQEAAADEAWKATNKAGKEEDYQSYLNKYPQGHYSELAKTKINKLQEAAADEVWKIINLDGGEADYQSYLNKYPQGRYSELAKTRKAEQSAREEPALWQTAQAGDNVQALQSYLNKYPGGSHASSAQEKLSLLSAKEDSELWNKTNSSNDKAVIETYLKLYPAGIYVAEAITKLGAIKDDEPLVQAMKLGNTYVISRGADTEVWVDNKKIGETSARGEVLVSNLNTGRHHVLARKDKLTWEQDIEVVSGKKTIVPVALDFSVPSLNTSLLSEIVTRVDSDYVVKPDLVRMLMGALRGIEKAVTKGAIIVSQTPDGVTLIYFAPNNTSARVALAFPKTSIELQKLVIFGASLAREVVPNLDQAKLEKLMFNEALANLDPHSSYLDAEAFKELQVGTHGEFGGLGIEVGMEDGLVKVVSPIEDTPAFNAGVKSGDLIIKLDDTPVKGLALTDAVKRMRGKPGSSVMLTIVRKTETKPLQISVTRTVIKVQSVKPKLIEPGYAFVRITQFQEHTGENLATALSNLQKQNNGALQGLVLDLRNDPGGLLSGAVAVSAAFLPKDALVVYTDGRTENAKMRLTANPDNYGKIDYLKDLPDGFKSVPMVVLMNGGSAAASEIVAGALQDHKRAVIMGTQSFGKGSLQTILPLGNNSAIKLTTARYYTPGGRSILSKGIEPDILVPMPLTDSFGTPDDVQLKHALDMLKGKMAGK